MILYDNNEKCCACTACYCICPQNAITMKTDIYGFLYPHINEKKCVDCGLCKRVCSLQNDFWHKEHSDSVYAVSIKDKEKLYNSASGGMFQILAENILAKGGTVFGAAILYEKEQIVVRHVEAKNSIELKKILGSKYVQSDMGDIYQVTKDRLRSGKYVLFSGTPCQVAGLRMYLKDDYPNLLTIDIICHGVPSQKFFQDYLDCFSKRTGFKVLDFCFRNKSIGWGLDAKVFYSDKNGLRRGYLLPSGKSSYYYYFLKSETYRESCYKCKYAGENRVGDITIGDYWGIEEEHSEALIENGGQLDVKAGISAVLVNTEKGKQWYDEIQSDIYSYESDFGKVARHNDQLREPSHYTELRDCIMQLYHKKGYAAVEKLFNSMIRRKHLKEKIRGAVRKIVPKKVKKWIKAIYKRK